MPPPVWWLEGSSYPIEILDEKVEVLVRSDELKGGAGTTLSLFPLSGEGIVYHMSSHFYLQRVRHALKSKASSSFAVDIVTIGESAN